MQNDPLAEVGKKLWLVDFMTSHIGDTGVNFEDGKGGSEEVHEVWADAIFENYTLLKGAVEGLKKAISMLPPEFASSIAIAYQQEDQEARARGAANCMLANVQREISERKGGEP